MKSDIFYGKKQLFAGGLILRVDTGAGENGCKEKYTGKFSASESTAEACQSFCNTRFIQYHESTDYCACFSQCDFARAASDYGAAAKVYQVAGKIF